MSPSWAVRSIPLAEILESDVILLFGTYGITVHWGKNVSPRANRSKREVWLRPIKGRTSYYVALHEIGHIVGDDAPRRLEQEVNAWRWALAHGIKAPTPGVWKMIHRCLSNYVERAKSWKSMKLPEPEHDFWILLKEAGEKKTT